jgi:hypothetical protein
VQPEDGQHIEDLVELHGGFVGFQGVDEPCGNVSKVREFGLAQAEASAARTDRGT